MKKIICLFLAIITLTALSSCTNKSDKNNENVQSEPNLKSSQNENTSSLDEDTKETGSDTVSNEFKGVVITLDNYKDYFEIKEHFYAYKDEFGDYFDCMTYGTYLCLKDEYEADTSYGKSDVKIKFETTYSWYGFDFNEETGEWKRLELINAYNDVYSPTEKFYDASKKEGFEDLTYIACICSNEVDVWPYDEGGFGDKYKYSVDCPENINITGITGTLYVREKSSE